MDLSDRVRLFALVTMALADAVGPTLTTKFTYAHWRPATAIAAAAEDENPNTDPDPTWRPRAGGAGGTPEHTSGHSSFSAAAATVIAGFFCQDNIAFSHASDSSGGQSRSFTSLSAAAAEAGISRVFGGLHFDFSNEAGLNAGRGVANEVLSRALLKKRGRTHLGSCPL
jgi:membrane-associated phospholipid phosphatase